jgi:hypothetical protein
MSTFYAYIGQTPERLPALLRVNRQLIAVAFSRSGRPPRIALLRLGYSPMYSFAGGGVLSEVLGLR